MGFGRLVGQMVEIRRLLLKKTLLRCVAGQDKQHAFHRMAARVSFLVSELRQKLSYRCEILGDEGGHPV